MHLGMAVMMIFDDDGSTTVSPLLIMSLADT